MFFFNTQGSIYVLLVDGYFLEHQVGRLRTLAVPLCDRMSEMALKYLHSSLIL